MNTPYYKLTPISDPPKKKDWFIVTNEMRSITDILLYSLSSKEWVSDDVGEGKLYTHYLAPCSFLGAVWVNGFKRKPVDPGHYDEPLKFVVRIKGDDFRSGWVYVGQATVEEIEKEKWDDYWEWLDESGTPNTLAKPAQGMRWRNISDVDKLPTGRLILFDGDAEPPVWAKVEYSSDTPDILIMGSSGEEDYYGDIGKYDRFLDESSTPSAREAELEREVERLKGLIQPAFIAGLSVDEDDPVGDSWHAFRKQHNL